MADKFLAYPTSYKTLSDEMIRMIDSYKNKNLPEADLKEALATWSNNVPDLLFEKNSTSEINGSLVRYIGKRRAQVALLICRSLK